ncbi:hypothetical protein OF83DRAFT_1171602 [Amylostereum chailletii]|nr:hypothetical protein OF83DRAFT_1171602 [Amylostereum chailletii]
MSRSSAPSSPSGKSAPPPPAIVHHSSSSESASTVKVSSPLNPTRASSQSPHTTPKGKAAKLPPSGSSPPSTTGVLNRSAPARESSPLRMDTAASPTHLTPTRTSSLTPPPRSRVQSFTSAGHEVADSPGIQGSPIIRVSSNPLPSTSTSPPSLFPRSFAHVSSVRDRSASGSRDPSPAGREVARVGTDDEDGAASPGSTWWRQKAQPPRPWHEGPKRKKTIPVEQTDGYNHTRQTASVKKRAFDGALDAAMSSLSCVFDLVAYEADFCRQRVQKAALSALGTAALIGHEMLFAGVDLLGFVPVPGLEVAARTLLSIWDALEMVEMNRLACLRLTERCADILLSVHQEIIAAGNSVTEELRLPIERLHAAFEDVHTFLKKQAHRPFLKRYLKKDEILRSIAYCDASLSDALGMFGLSIQIRTLKTIQANEARRKQDNDYILDSLGLSGLPPPSTTAVPLIADVPSPTDPEVVQALLRNIRIQQNARDRSRDMADLRQLMRAALQTNNDAAMIEVLQVGRDEMPEAIKTLQRALEREVEREWSSDSTRGSTIESLDSSPAWRPKGRGRSATVTTASVGSTPVASGTVPLPDTDTVSDSSSKKKQRGADTLDREFIESGIDALRRLSQGAELVLPSWTITRYEVDLEEKIGIGSFSDVYKGRWREHTVAIKVLAETTPRKLFIHEIGIWKALSHPNVVELLGASSASGDPPWFLVSPYYSHGSLVQYLKGVDDLMQVDYLKMMHEIAKGMAYLHEMDVLHGDLKAANVLVDDRLHCVISDFGQSEMKSEVYRLSRAPIPHGTLRWQAPELMMGADVLTPEMDVYAFAISCVEIMTKGTLPWPLADDDAVRRFVLEFNQRPNLPLIPLSGTSFSNTIHACWQRDPRMRPPFAQIARDIQVLRSEIGVVAESPRPPSLLSQWELEVPHRPSPDLRPVALPNVSAVQDDMVVGSASTDGTFVTASSGLEAARRTSRGHGPEDDADVPLVTVRSRSSSLTTLRTGSSLLEDSGLEDSMLLQGSLVSSGYLSPPDPDDLAAGFVNERRYRMLLQHDYHTSLTLPLWTPVPVALGAVGYLSKPEGSFVTLFNCYDRSTPNGLPSFAGYGKVTSGIQRQEKRNAAQRGLDMVQNYLYSRKKPDGNSGQPVSRTQAFQLRAGHKVAHLYAESTVYRYLADPTLHVPKMWFQNNIDQILKLYGKEHKLTREDVFLVIGTLEAENYGMFVSHSHPDGQVNFNVFTAARAGEAWGEFAPTTAALPSATLSGPVYDGEMFGNIRWANKVSRVRTSSNSGKADAILLARLRFKPDAAEPTRL